MSEKHLTETPWKTFATAQKLKDPGLGKALAAFAKADANDPAARLEALEAVEKEAGDLKKEQKKNAEIAGYLDEVLKEAAKTRKVLDALRKGAEEEEGEDEEAQEYKKDLKKHLVNALSQIKALGAEVELEKAAKFMAYTTAGGSAVLVARKVGGAAKKLLPEIAGNGGGKYISGACIFENDAHTFIVERIPGGLAKQLSRALVNETGHKYPIRVRTADGSATVDEASDVEPGEPVAPISPDLAEQWKELKRVLAPEIKKALEANPPNRAQIIQIVTEANQSEKAANFQAAIDLFHRLKPLLAAPPPSQPSAPPQPPPPGGELSAQYQQRLRAILPELQRALKEQLGDTAKMRAVVELMKQRAGAGDYGVALKAIDGLEKLLAASHPPVPGPQPSTPQQPPTFDEAAFRQKWPSVREIWEKALESVNGQIEKLQAALRQTQDEDLHEIAEIGLPALTRNLRTPLIAAMIGIDLAGAEKLPQAIHRMDSIAKRFSGFLETDKRIKETDANDFAVTVTIRDTLGGALKEISTALAAFA